MRQFVELWFGLPVKELPPLQGKELRRFKARSSRGFGPQLLAAEVAQYLQVLKPFDCLCVMGYTLFDLYEQEGANHFVYGTTLLERAAGVFSFARWRTDDGPLFLRRCAGTLVHEIGHFFGLATCIWYWCTMNGYGHEAEIDGAPLMLCPVDLRKLDTTLSAHLGGLDFLQQAERLADWCSEHGLETDAAWWARRYDALARLPTGEAASAVAPREPQLGARRSHRPPSPAVLPRPGGLARRSTSGGAAGRLHRAHSETSLRRPQEESPAQLSAVCLSPVRRGPRHNTTGFEASPALQAGAGAALGAPSEFDLSGHALAASDGARRIRGSRCMPPLRQSGSGALQ